MIQWECRQCGEGIEVPESLASDAIECPQCGVFSRPPDELIPNIRTAPEVPPRPKLPPPEHSAREEVQQGASREGQPNTAVRTASAVHRTGITLIVLGSVVAAIGFFFDTAPGGTHNIGIINDRLVITLLGCTGFISGATLFGIGSGANAILSAMSDQRTLFSREE